MPDQNETDNTGKNNAISDPSTPGAEIQVKEGPPHQEYADGDQEDAADQAAVITGKAAEIAVEAAGSLDNQTGQSVKADGADQPTSKELQIAVAIDSFKAQYAATQSDSRKHEKEVLKWTKWAALGVFVYTLITAAIFGASMRQNKIASAALGTAVAELPRGWLYVETKDPGTDANPTGDGGFSVAVSFSIKNYGATPAVIRSVGADLLVPDSGQAISLPIGGFETSVAGFQKASGSIFENDLVGRVVGPPQIVRSSPEVAPTHPVLFNFKSRSDLTSSNAFGVVKWLRVIVKYSDPNGANRETSSVFSLTLAGRGTMLVTDTVDTYWR